MRPNHLRLLIGLSVVSVAVAAFLLSDRQPRQDPAPVNVASAADAPRLWLIGNDRGMIRPCGCSQPKLGGIDRRMDLLVNRSAAKAPGSAVLAFGNLVVSGLKQQRLKLEAFLQVLVEMQVVAFCPGDGDMQVGVSFWQEIAPQLATFPLVSLNLHYRGERLFRPGVRFDVTDGPVVVTGWVSPTTSRFTEPGLSASEAFDAAPLRELLTATSDKPTLVVFGTGSEAEVVKALEGSGLRPLTRRTVIVLTGVSDLPTLAIREYGALIEIGTKGRWVGECILAPTPRLEVHTLDAQRASHPIGADILHFYRETVAAERLLENEPLAARAPGEYAGSDACAKCHPMAFKTWSESRHAHAFATLEGSGDTRDPECVRCHVTGFGMIGGFDPLTAAPHDVQCEACHGPSAAHAKTLEPTPGGRLRDLSCRRCHDLENSPAFTFELYWPKIAHDAR